MPLSSEALLSDLFNWAMWFEPDPITRVRFEHPSLAQGIKRNRMHRKDFAQRMGTMRTGV